MQSNGDHLFGCIHAPDFSVQAVLRAEGVCCKRDSLAVLDGPESLQKVFACNAAARQAGISVGMTKVQAALLPTVTLRKRMMDQEQAAHAALMDCGYSFSPRVESTCPGTVIVELTGAERLLGWAINISSNLSARVLECGIEANVALAANPDAALHAARGFSGITVIHRGKEAIQMASLPIAVLQPEAELLQTLESWGVRDFQSLAALPSLPLKQRLGEYGLCLQQLARGETQRELIPAEPVTRFQESMDLEEPLELLEPLGFVLNRLLEHLLSRLTMRALATDRVQLDLELEVHADRQLKSGRSATVSSRVYHRTLKLPVPTQDIKILLKLLQLDLAANPPQAPIRKVSVEVVPAKLRVAQAGLFQPRAPEPAKLEVTLARLRATVGEKDDQGREMVGFPIVNDSYKPDDFTVMPVQPQAEREEEPELPAVPVMALRRFRPPLQAKVEVAGNAPVSLVFQGKKKNIVNASGPWRNAGAWWDKAGEWNRDEWDVEAIVQGGRAVYRIFRDHQSGQWFVDGMYD